MVMRNTRDGTNSSDWWDDLPPGVRKRVSRPDPEPENTHPTPAETPYRPAVVSDLSRLAILMLVFALANVLFLMLALSYLSGRGPFGN